VALRLLFSETHLSNDKATPEEESMRRISGILMAATLAATTTACVLDDPDVDDESLDEIASEEPAQGAEDQHGVATAARETAPRDCNAGAFCGYAGVNYTGALLLETQGNWSGKRAGVRSVYNNGVQWLGADHVQLTWEQGGECWTRCFHYNPGPGHKQPNFGSAVQLTSVRWRGECAAGEDRTRRCCPGCQ
jgi:hypothetical protein